MSLRTLALPLLLAALALVALAAPPKFSGTWVLNNSRSKNLGMMAAMADTAVITQTGRQLVVTETAALNGDTMKRVTRYDLSGTSVPNDSPTGDPARTTSHWQGGELVTLWITRGSVAGTTHQRTERRYLSADGRTMFEVSESKPGDPKALVLVFERR